MTKQHVAGFLAAVCLAVLLAAAAPTGKSHTYVVEYQKAPVGGAPQVQLTLFDGADAGKAAALLKKHLEVVVETYKPTEDTLGTAWDAKEEQLGETLIYRADKKVIEVFK